MAWSRRPGWEPRLELNGGRAIVPIVAANECDGQGPRQPPLARADRESLYEKSVERFSQWVQFEDAKASAVLVLVGLGLVDLLGHAGRLIDAHLLRSDFGLGATAFFATAIASAAVAVFFVIYALMPRYTLTPLRRKPAEESVFFFGSVALWSRQGYQDRVASMSPDDLEREMASEAWQLARIADRKVKLAGWAYAFVILFLISWALARVTLSLAD